VDGEADELGVPSAAVTVKVSTWCGAAIGVAAGEELHGGVGDGVGVGAVAGQDEAAEIAGAGVTVVLKWFSPVSTSVIEIEPVAVRVVGELSSVTSATFGSPITAASLVPWMVKLTSLECRRPRSR